MMHFNPARIVLISGSSRPGSRTTAVLKLAEAEFSAHGLSTEFIDPADLELGGWESSLTTPVFLELAGLVRRADAVVLATPEYNGSYSAIMKGFIESLGYPSPLAGKPVALLGVASGVIGAVKALEHLRSVAAHCGAHVLPFAFSIAEVHRVMDESGALKEPRLQEQLIGLCAALKNQILRQPMIQASEGSSHY